MKVQESVIIERLCREMKFRNYSLRTIKSYSASLSKVEDFYHFSIDKITVPQLKDFLYHRLTKDKVSVSLVNQTISAYKIFWEENGKQSKSNVHDEKKHYLLSLTSKK